MAKPDLLLDKSPERIRRMFDGIASWYDFLNHFLSLGIDRSWRKRSARRLIDDALPEGPILDLCCGTGDLTLAFHRRLEQRSKKVASEAARSLAGIDFSPEMIAHALKKTERIRKNARIDFSVGDATSLPFEDGSFALVCVSFGLRNIVDTEQGLAEMVRVCKSGGKVGVLEFSMPTHPLIAGPYRLYFRAFLPRLGRFFAGNHDNAYNYLPESVLMFDSPELLGKRLEKLGLTDIRSFPMTFGIATLTVGTVGK